MNFIRIFLLLVTSYGLLVTDLSHADTVHTKEGAELKGIVVEDYRDRIVFSTVDGEIPVMKSNIVELYFDSEEDNLIKLAEQARERKDYLKAYVYYDRALKLNPASKIALDGVIFLQGYLFRKEQALKEEDVKKREAIENYGAIIPAESSGLDKEKEACAQLKKTIGITLVDQAGFPVVDSVYLKSPASEADIRKGDKLIAVWGRLTGYLSLSDVMNMFLDKPSLELKVTIERALEVKLDPWSATGASLSMEFDGLTVSDVQNNSPAFHAGVKKGDLITAINGQSTRYMPLNKSKDAIKHSKDRSVKFNIKREVLIWRRD